MSGASTVPAPTRRRTASAAADAVVIGAGANGLVAALALARAGRRVTVVERADVVGGQARAIEFAAEFHAPLTPDAGWVPPPVARLLGRSVPQLTASETAVTVASEDREFFELPVASRRATEAIRRRSPRDAARWPAFAARMRKLAGFLESLYLHPPPDIDARSIGEVLPLVGLGRKFRALGRESMIELLRVMPMPVQDLLDDEFESDALKAAIASAGVRDIRHGPRAGGTSFVLLHNLVGAPEGSLRARGSWRTAPDAFAGAVASAVRDAGVAIRCGEVIDRILVRDDAVTGIALASGDEIRAPVVISTADPRRTIGMVDQAWLDPELMHAVRQIRFRGCTGFVHYAVDRLPELAGVADSRRALAEAVSLTPTLDALERAADAAKYGMVPEVPHIEITIPTLRWPQLAPERKHVLVARVQYSPYALRDGASWDDSRSCALAEAVSTAIERAIPGFGTSVMHRAVLTPRDLESRFHLTEGALTHGELALDQILFMRPVPGYGRHAMPVAGLYLGGAGAHPGPGVLGGPGWLAANRALHDGRRS
jgi:phytoene dehydrogenase-like protein